MVRSAYMSILTIFFIASTCFADQHAFLGSSHSEERKDVRIEKQLNRLFSVLITRTSVASNYDYKTLLPAIHAGANAFVDAVNHNKQSQKFSRHLQPLLDVYDAEVANASVGVEGAEARGLAMDHLFAGVLDAAKGEKIDLKVVDMAFLEAAAVIEKSILKGGAAKSLTLEDKELIFLLLLNSAAQIHRRVVLLEEPFEALLTLGTEPSLVTAYAQRLFWTGSALASELVGLEKKLADPDVVGNLNNLTMMQFDEEARNDMFFFKVSLETAFFSFNSDLVTLLVAKMASADAIMSGISVIKLQESGLLMTYNSFLNMSAYNWVTPASQFVYAMSSTLTDKLETLGVDVPPLPDFSVVTTPYRDIFELRYDLSLCDEIRSKEWLDTEEKAFADRHPVTMAKRLLLRKADAARRQAVMMKMAGISHEEKRSLQILLSKSFR